VAKVGQDCDTTMQRGEEILYSLTGFVGKQRDDLKYYYSLFADTKQQLFAEKAEPLLSSRSKKDLPRVYHCPPLAIGSRLSLYSSYSAVIIIK
jgi:hypothetical protein